jgi:hypothetical protein
MVTFQFLPYPESVPYNLLLISASKMQEKKEQVKACLDD